MPEPSEIFALRKSGKIEEAYSLAVQAFAVAPDDEWVVRAYGWVLYDKLKVALQNPDQAIIQQLVQEITTLNVPESDEMLFPNLKRLLERAQPQGQELQRAKDLDRNNQHAEAHIIFRSLRESYIGNTQFADSYGWCIYKYLKQIVAQTPINIDLCKSLLDEYLILTIEKPSILHSSILRVAEKLIGNESFPFMIFIKKWGYHNFLPDDWDKYKIEGKEYPGLAEKTIQIVAKSLLTQSSGSDIQDFIPSLDTALTKIHDNIWLYYYKAKLLMKIGNIDEAEMFLKPVVKKKRTEYWAWALMGEIYKESSLDKAISCYCKALLCPAEEKFLINTRVALGKLLLQKELKTEAKREFSKSIETRKENSYGLGADLVNIEQEDWFTTLKVDGDNRKFYNENIKLAEEILFADLPWFDANVGEDYSLPDKPDVVRIKIYFKVNGILVETSVKERQHKIYKRFEQGEPARLKAESSGNKWQVYLIENREVGHKWDIFPEYVGIVDHINMEKHVAHFIISKQIEGILRLNKEDAKLEIGDSIKVILKNRIKDGVKIYETINWTKTNDVPPEEICRKFNGRFVIESGRAFGFVDDYFVDPAVVQEYSLKEMNGRMVSGTAIISYNKNKRSWGWKAIKFSNYE